MGDPRRLKKKYKTPTNPFEKERILDEMRFVGKYGLRNKKELRKHHYQLSGFRALARGIRALPEEQGEIKFKELSGRLTALGLVSEGAHTDDVLSLNIDSILNRRLQTYVFKRQLASTIVQARQLVVHNHIMVNGRIINSPSYLVKKSDEESVEYAVNSPFKLDSSKLMGSVKSVKVEEVKEEVVENKEKKA